MVEQVDRVPKWAGSIVIASWALLGCGSNGDHQDTLVRCGGYETSFRAVVRNAPDDLRFLRTLSQTAVREIESDPAVGDVLPAGMGIQLSYPSIAESYRDNMDLPRFDRLKREGAEIARRHHDQKDATAAGHFFAECARSYAALTD